MEGSGFRFWPFCGSVASATQWVFAESIYVYMRRSGILLSLYIWARFSLNDRKLCKIMATSMQRFYERKNKINGDPADFESITSDDRRKWQACAKFPRVSAERSRDWSTVDDAQNTNRAVMQTPPAIRNPKFFLDASHQEVKQSKDKEKGARLFQNFKLDTQTRFVTCSRPPVLEENIWWTKKDLRREKVVLRNRINEKDRYTLHDEKVWFSETGRCINKRAELKKKLRDYSRRNDSDKAKESMKMRHTMFASLNVKDRLNDEFRDTSCATTEGLGGSRRRIRDGKQKSVETESIQSLSKLLNKSGEQMISLHPRSESDGFFGGLSSVPKKKMQALMFANMFCRIKEEE
eukprot:GEMP01028696.1.p1 GENE.GEMP01028696.1~~GEMP01028696.1.p1  ORF type:complete len:349 (+),score=47.27 GEMP01028696.1:228-1274(+)